MLKRRKSIRRISTKQLEKNKLKAEQTRELHKWFLSLWDEQQDDSGNCYCYETGRRLSRDVYRENTCCYSHLLPKHKYPEYAKEAWNVVIVHPEAHTQFEMYPEKAPKQQELKQKLIKDLDK